MPGYVTECTGLGTQPLCILVCVLYLESKEGWLCETILSVGQ